MRALLAKCVAIALVGAGGASAAERATVAVIASDMPGLAVRAHADSVPSQEAINEMVREAMLAGGIRDVLRPDARHVLLKPCIVVAVRSSWRNTDPRAVKAVALVVHEIAPKAKITVGEGPGAWMKEARPEVRHWELTIADGFETEGYYAAFEDPRLADAEIEFVDLNFAEPRLVKVPGGGWARDEYWIAAPVLEADVAITVPRIKTHMASHGGITVAMKNQMGVAPGMKYGWPKKTGYPSGSGNPGIPHSPEILGEMITDLNLCAGIDFAVAESFRRDFDEPWGNRRQWIGGVVAGADMVAVDAVSAYLMGFNPGEVETVVNGDRRGLGIGRLGAIDLVGETDLDRTRRGFGGSEMGMANRLWIVSGPHPRTEAGMNAVDPTKPIRTGVQGFDEPVWFQDDKCDLGQLLGKPSDCVAFAYCEFDAPRSGPAKLQVASDEGMTVWLNGAEVYRFDGWRRVERPNEMVSVEVAAGRNAVLCRLEQTSRVFQFSLNVVAADPDTLANRHHRIKGLKFSVPGPVSVRDVLAQDMRFHDSWGMPGQWRDRASVNQTRSDSVAVEGQVPELLQAKALGVVRSRYFGENVRARAVVRGEDVVIRSAYTAELWADLAALRGPGKSAAVSAVEVQLRWEGPPWRLVESVRDSSVVWSGTVPAAAVLVLARPDTTAAWSARWTAKPPPPKQSADVVIGESTGELASGVFRAGLAQSTGGALLAEAYRDVVGADLGIAQAWEVFNAIPAGPIERGDLLDLISPWMDDARVASWTMTGAEVDSVLQHLVNESIGDPRDTPQLAGFTAAVDLSRPEGQRVVQLSLDPLKTYRVATVNWRSGGWYKLAGRGDEGEWADLVVHPMTPYQAVEAFLAEHRPYTPAQEERLIARSALEE